LILFDERPFSARVNSCPFSQPGAYSLLPTSALILQNSLRQPRNGCVTIPSISQFLRDPSPAPALRGTLSPRRGLTLLDGCLRGHPLPAERVLILFDERPFSARVNSCPFSTKHAPRVVPMSFAPAGAGEDFNANRLPRLTRWAKIFRPSGPGEDSRQQAVCRRQ